MSYDIKVADYACPVQTLGPGKRFVLWVQGCCFDCDGCTSPEWRSHQGGVDFDIRSLSELILGHPDSAELEGITLSGGEPMLQAEAVLLLWLNLLERYPHWTLFLYTGFTSTEIMASGNEARINLMRSADVIVDGRYVESANNGLGLRGSTNQRFIIKNQRYSSMKKYFENCERSLEWRFRDKSFLFAGVPPLGFKDSVSKAIELSLVNSGDY